MRKEIKTNLLMQAVISYGYTKSIISGISCCSIDDDNVEIKVNSNNGILIGEYSSFILNKKNEISLRLTHLDTDNPIVQIYYHNMKEDKDAKIKALEKKLEKFQNTIYDLEVEIEEIKGCEYDE